MKEDRSALLIQIEEMEFVDFTPVMQLFDG